MAIFGSLSVNITAKTDDLANKTKEAEEVVDSFGASITSKISEIATVAEPLASLSVLLLWRSVYSSPQPVQPLI